jgi:hypothetical protein
VKFQSDAATMRQLLKALYSSVLYLPKSLTVADVNKKITYYA